MLLDDAVEMLEANDCRLARHDEHRPAPTPAATTLPYSVHVNAKRTCVVAPAATSTIRGLSPATLHG